MSSPPAWLRLACLAISLVLTSACAGPRLAGGTRAEPLQVAATTLPDASNGGLPMAMRAAPGELLLVYFGYTSCPDVCPTTMADVGQAIRGLPAELGARVDVAMVTLDPERDSAEHLTLYLAHFFERSHALRTTDMAQLSAAASSFGVRWDVEAHEAGEAYELSHTAVTYAVDAEGSVLVEWPFGMDYELMRSDMEILLARYQ